MASVDVHEIQGHRGPRSVIGKPSRVPIEFKGRIDVGHNQHRMSHALRPGTVTCDYAVSGGMIHWRSASTRLPAGSRKEITSAAPRSSATAALSRRTATEIDLHAGDNPNEWNVYFNGLPRRKKRDNKYSTRGKFRATSGHILVWEP
jgi:hypothetical protein